MASVPVIFIPSSSSKSSNSHVYRDSTQTPIQPDHYRTITEQPKEPPAPSDWKHKSDGEQFGILLMFAMIVPLALLFFSSRSKGK